MANIVVSLLHFAMIFIGAKAYYYFGAPSYFIQHAQSWYVVVLMMILSGLFFIVGLYGLSAAAYIRRLPGVWAVIFLVGVLYTLRGSVVILMPFPELVGYILKNYPGLLGMDRPLLIQDWVFSALWLLAGLTYLCAWVLSRLRMKNTL